MIKIISLTLILMTRSLVGSEIKFVDLSLLNQLVFKHNNGGSGSRFYVETIGSGVCLFDYDNDLDIYIFAKGSHYLVTRPRKDL